MDYVNAFWVGGLICALCQILMEKTKMQPGRIMVLLVCSGAVLGAIGVYPLFVEFAGAGASVPLLGFGNTLFKGIKEAVDTNGFIGIFMGGFTATAVGISAALVFAMMVVCLFGSMAACGNRNGNEENTTENGAGSNNTTNKNDTDNKNNTNDKNNRDNTTNNGDNGDGVVNDVTDGVVDGAEDIVDGVDDAVDDAGTGIKDAVDDATTGTNGNGNNNAKTAR